MVNQLRPSAQAIASCACAIASLTFAITQVAADEPKPAAKPAAPVAAAPARLIPQENLLAGLEFDGLDKEADTWQKTAAYALLSETKLGGLIEELALQAIDAMQDSIPREKRVHGPEAVAALKQILRDGFRLGIVRKGSEDAHVIVILRRGDRPELKRLLESIDASRSAEPSDEKSKIAPRDAGWGALHRLGDEAAWATSGGDLIVARGSHAREHLEAVLGKESPPKELSPVAQAREDRAFRPVATGFVDLKMLAGENPLPDLDGFKRIEFHWGFDEKALLTQIRVVAPSPRPGLAALLDQAPFATDALPPMPARLSHISVVSLDLVKLYDQIARIGALVNGSNNASGPNSNILVRHGIDLRGDVLTHVDSKLAFYAIEPRSEDTSSPAAALLSHLSGLTIAAKARDQTAVTKGVDSLIKSFNPIVREIMRTVPRGRAGASVSFLKFAQDLGMRPFYVLDLPSALLPPPFVKALTPTVAIEHGQLVLSASKGAAQAALAEGPPWAPSEELSAALKKLPSSVIYLSLSDPRASTGAFLRMLPVLIRQTNAEIAMARNRSGKSDGDVTLRLDPGLVPSTEELNRLLFPSSTAVRVDQGGATLTHREAITTLTSPVVAGALAAMLAPTIAESLESAKRTNCLNNLRRIAAGIHGFLRSANGFPTPAILSQDGKPLLSWRVAILPYLGYQELFDKFKKDEPWDSPHNKALLNEMPSAYSCSSQPKNQPFATNYRMLVGKNALFEEREQVRIAAVTDGTANTIMVVESSEWVPWTKPGELVFDPQAAPSLCGAGSLHTGGFHAAMANGVVRFLKNTIDLKVFHALITRAGGEFVGPGAF
jgi:hypothetical protein